MHHWKKIHLKRVQGIKNFFSMNGTVRSTKATWYIFHIINKGFIISKAQERASNIISEAKQIVWKENLSMLKHIILFVMQSASNIVTSLLHIKRSECNIWKDCVWHGFTLDRQPINSFLIALISQSYHNYQRQYHQELNFFYHYHYYCQ